MTEKRHLLSKSTFMYGYQCPKRLFFHKNRPELRNEEDESQQSIFQSGTNVGELARQLFPNGVDASPPDSYSYNISVNLTSTLIAQGEQIIYEAAFQYEGVLCALDILVKKGDRWYAFEVKSTTSVKDQHIQDAALQYYVLTNCGISIEDISIVHLNNQYVRKGELDIQQLFNSQSIVEDVKERQSEIRKKVRELKDLLNDSNEPKVDIGSHCFDPYECDFTNHCWSHIPKENSIFDLRTKEVWNLYAEGYRSIDDIPEDYELGNKATMQLAHYRSGEVHINKELIKEFLKPLVYPLYFFDFETIMPAIPEFENSRPYQQIPFQFSLHIQKQPDAKLEHFGFLGDGISDPRKLLIERMLELLGKDGSIVCYNMSFEKSRIKDLAEIYPQYESELFAINDRVSDLMIPFQKRWYYHPAFNGSYSIKAVLPVLVPNLTYENLEVQNGGIASLVYGQLKSMDEETKLVTHKNLSDYCERDTVGMVEILACLNRLVQ